MDKRQQVDGLCVGVFLYVCRHWRMAEFYKDDDKHVIGLLHWLGWGEGHALLPLLPPRGGTSTRAVHARGFPLDGTCPFTQTQSGMYTHPQPPTHKHLRINSLLSHTQAAQTLCAYPSRHQTINPLSSPTPDPPSLPPFTYSTGWHQRILVHRATATTRVTP